MAGAGRRRAGRARAVVADGGPAVPDVDAAGRREPGRRAHHGADGRRRRRRGAGGRRRGGARLLPRLPTGASCSGCCAGPGGSTRPAAHPRGDIATGDGDLEWIAPVDLTLAAEAAFRLGDAELAARVYARLAPYEGRPVCAGSGSALGPGRPGPRTVRRHHRGAGTLAARHADAALGPVRRLADPGRGGVAGRRAATPAASDRVALSRAGGGSRKAARSRRSNGRFRNSRQTRTSTAPAEPPICLICAGVRPWSGPGQDPRQVPRRLVLVELADQHLPVLGRQVALDERHRVALLVPQVRPEPLPGGDQADGESRALVGVLLDLAVLRQPGETRRRTPRSVGSISSCSASISSRVRRALRVAGGVDAVQQHRPEARRPRRSGACAARSRRAPTAAGAAARWPGPRRAWRARRRRTRRGRAGRRGA